MAANQKHRVCKTLGQPFRDTSLQQNLANAIHTSSNFLDSCRSGKPALSNPRRQNAPGLPLVQRASVHAGQGLSLFRPRLMACGSTPSTEPLFLVKDFIAVAFQSGLIYKWASRVTDAGGGLRKLVVWGFTTGPPLPLASENLVTFG